MLYKRKPLKDDRKHSKVIELEVITWNKSVVIDIIMI